MEQLQPIDYNFTLNYVNIKDVYFSQAFVTLCDARSIYATLDKIRCSSNEIKLVFFENNIYVIGFFGKEMEKDLNTQYKPPPKYPLIEVVDYGEQYPYVTINNRRLLFIYMLLYSITKMTIDVIDEKYNFFLTRRTINDLDAFFKDMLKEKYGIIIENIYIPVLINKSSEIAPEYLFEVDFEKDNPDTPLTWDNFIKERIFRQSAFCNKKIKPSGTKCQDFDAAFTYGAPVVPKVGNPDVSFKYGEIKAFDRRQPSPIRPFVSTTLGDYENMLHLFNILSKNISPDSVCLTKIPSSKDDVPQIELLQKLKTICTCYHRPISKESFKYISTITPQVVAEPSLEKTSTLSQPSPSSSPRGGSKKRRRCPNGTRRNIRTKKCNKYKKNKTRKRKTKTKMNNAPFNIGIDFGGVLSLHDSKENVTKEHVNTIIDMPGAIKSLEKLNSQNNNLYLISFCGKNRAISTNKSISDNSLAYLFKEQFYVKNASYKKDVCKRLGCNFMIDDREDVLDEVKKSNTEIITILFGKSQNECLNNNHKCAENWEDIVKIISSTPFFEIKGENISLDKYIYKLT